MGGQALWSSAHMLAAQHGRPPARPSLQPPHVCSELARLGKEKLLFAARDSLHGVRGRTTLLRPSVQVEPLLLPGAMALLHQVRGRRCERAWNVRGGQLHEPWPLTASHGPSPPTLHRSTLAALAPPYFSCAATSW